MAKIAKKKKTIDPAKLEQIQFNNAVRTVFMRPGFQRFPSENSEFQFRGRTGELDDVFLHQNVFVICEYTTGKATSSHLGKKKFLFDEIINNPVEWISFYRSISTGFDEYFDSSSYDENDYRIRIVYCSKKGTHDELPTVYPAILYLDMPQINYFRATSVRLKIEQI